MSATLWASRGRISKKKSGYVEHVSNYKMFLRVATVSSSQKWDLGQIQVFSN